MDRLSSANAGIINFVCVFMNNLRARDPIGSSG
jgi:hypothetical protein